MEYLQKKAGKTHLDLSRLYVYWNSRYFQKTTNYDSGASIRLVIKALAQWGACSEDKWPYVISKFKAKPSSACYKDGNDREIQDYLRVQTITEIKQAVASGFPVVFGFPVKSSFLKTGKNGKVPVPGAAEKVTGGHCMLIVGYDDAKHCFIVRNSWGTRWGDKGYCYMDYAHADRDFSDMWVIRGCEGL